MISGAKRQFKRTRTVELLFQLETDVESLTLVEGDTVFYIIGEKNSTRRLFKRQFKTSSVMVGNINAGAIIR